MDLLQKNRTGASGAAVSRDKERSWFFLLGLGLPKMFGFILIERVPLLNEVAPHPRSTELKSLTEEQVASIVARARQVRRRFITRASTACTEI